MSEQGQPPVLMEDPAPYPQMTVERIPRVSWRKLLIVWLAAVGAVVLINLAAIVLLPYSTVNKGQYIVRTKWELLNNLEEPVDVLILGDSSANQGVIPQMITDQTGKTVLNLATIGTWGLVDDVWMLTDYIERFGPPEMVIIVHVYDILPREVINVVNLADAPLPYGFWENDGYNPELDSETEFEIGWRRLFPLYYRDLTLKETLRLAITFEWDAFRQPPINDKGFMTVTETQVENFERFMPIIQNQETINFFVSRVNTQVAPAIPLLAEIHGFDVVIFNSPLYDKVAELPIIQAHLPRVQAWWQENVAAISPRVRYVTDLAAMPLEQMAETIDHVNLEGARIYTQFVIDRVWGDTE